MSLLPVGLTASTGKFVRGDLVSCVDHQGNEIARGLVNYNAEETQRIMGKSSSELSDILGYANDVELIHRNDLVVL